MMYQTYPKSPLDIVDIRGSKRFRGSTISIQWNLIPPGHGRKKFPLWRRMKQHIEDIVPDMASMSAEDLQEIILASYDGRVPPIFGKIAGTFQDAIKNEEFVTTLRIGNGHKVVLFDYEEGLPPVRYPVKPTEKFLGIDFKKFFDRLPKVNIPQLPTQSFNASTAS